MVPVKITTDSELLNTLTTEQLKEVQQQVDALIKKRTRKYKKGETFTYDRILTGRFVMLHPDLVAPWAKGKVFFEDTVGSIFADTVQSMLTRVVGAEAEEQFSLLAAGNYPV